MAALVLSVSLRRKPWVQSAVAFRRTASHHHPAGAAVALAPSAESVMESATISAREERVLTAQSGAVEKRGLGLVMGGDLRWRDCHCGDKADFALGSGLGLTSVSPWYNSGLSATAFGVWAAVWLIIVQWLSAALDGYLTGRPSGSGFTPTKFTSATRLMAFSHGLWPPSSRRRRWRQCFPLP